MPLALITVPYASTGLTTGEARAPDALRAAGLLEALRGAGADVADYGNVPFAPPRPERDSHSGIIAPETLSNMILAVRAAVARATAAGRLPIVVGGECPLLLGCLAAIRDTHGRVGLLFVDGHEDAWPPHASTTGEAADMELGLALGLSEPLGLPSLTSLLPVLEPRDVVLIGPRDQDEIAAAGIPSLTGTIPWYSDVAVRRAGAGNMGTTAAEPLRSAAGQWWFHLDLDVLSTESLGAVRYPQPGGLRWDELEQVAAAALDVPGVAGVDLTIYNPDLDPDGSDAARIVQFVAAMAATVSQLLS